MTRRTAFFLLAVAATAASFCGRRPAAPPLNVVVILIDDLGWTDTGAYGSTFYETPAIDRLAREGARFTRFYTASPVCSPTRASLMTGKYPARVGITDWIGGDQKGRLLPAPYLDALPLDEVTVGEAFEAAGYVTGYAGKWHLGADLHMPVDQGFAETFAVNHAGQPSTYFAPYHRATPSPMDVPDLEHDQPGEYLTDRLTDAAVDFLTRHRDDKYFYVLSHYSVHTPLEAPEATIEKYRQKHGGPPDVSEDAFEPEGPSFTKLHQDQPTYAAMIEATDHSVARVLEALDATGVADHTLVVFLSDNGGLSTLLRRGPNTPTSNAPLRAGKGWLYEGGIRAPLIVRWPGVVRPGLVVDGPAITTDLYPTLLDAAGLPPKPDQHVDGLSLAAALRGDRPLPARTL
ncbi:MAG: sulfatase, partial [Vicinamibacterales bacterium]